MAHPPSPPFASIYFFRLIVQRATSMFSSVEISTPRGTLMIYKLMDYLLDVINRWSMVNKIYPIVSIPSREFRLPTRFSVFGFEIIINFALIHEISEW
jgi:hypothetical protein